MRVFHCSLALGLFAGAALAQDGHDLQLVPRSVTLSATGAGGLSVLYSNVPGLPSASVPGLPFEFAPGGGSSSAFDRPFASPNGNWILTATMATPATTDDEVILLNGVVVGREGDPAPWAPGEAYGTIDTRVEVNDAGQWVLVTNTDGPPSADDYVVRGDGGGLFTVIAKEGDPIAALPGSTWDDLLQTPVLLADGTAGLVANGIDGAVTIDADELVVLGAATIAQEGVTIPPGQLGGAMDAWENFDLDDYFVTEDGAHTLLQGDLFGLDATDDVLVFDGGVVLQEAVVVPGSGFTQPIDTSGIVGCFLDDGGNWYARGNNDFTEQDWVVRNGVVVAKVGAPIAGGTAEAWTDAEFLDCFFLHVGNSVGDYVIGGVTNAPTTANAVLVKNGSEVLCREDDPVDLDGNGVLDDDAFINAFGNDDGVLLDDGTFFFVATLRDGAGGAFAQAFLKLVPAAGGPTALCFGDGGGAPCGCGNEAAPGSNGGCLNTAGVGAVLLGSGTPSVSADSFSLSADHVINQPGLFFQGDDAIGGGAGATFGDGLRCCGANVVGIQVVDPPGTASPATAVMTETATTNGPMGTIQPGDTKCYQYWYRDPSGGGVCGSSFNLSSALLVTWEA